MPRWLLRGVGTTVVALVALGAAPGAALAAPGDAEVADAQATRDAAAAQVGQISAQLADAEAASAAAHQAAQIALQEYEERQAAQQEAQAAADDAAEDAERARTALTRGREQVADFARSTYMQGSTAPGTAALMSAEGPTQLLERAALLHAAGDHRVDVVDQLTVLEQRAADADRAAQDAVEEAEALQDAAAESLATAQDQEVAARAQAAALDEQRTTWEAELAEAQEALYGAQGARAAAAAAAAAQEAARSRPPAPASSSSGGSSAGSSGGASSGSASSGNASSGGSSSGTTSSGTTSSGTTSSGGAPAPVSTTAASPSRSAVQTAIAAAKSQRGLPYSWGGGDGTGPTYGIPPDTAVYGFDCSGLTEYAYAQAGIAIGGTSREQYRRLRDRTVAASDLQAGDLVFWASGSAYTSIYHVALYIGGGQVIQAPQSGDVVRISSMWFGSDYFGAVRPTG